VLADTAFQGHDAHSLTGFDVSGCVSAGDAGASAAARHRCTRLCAEALAQTLVIAPASRLHACFNMVRIRETILTVAVRKAQYLKDGSAVQEMVSTIHSTYGYASRLLSSGFLTIATRGTPHQTS
jgi:hypothetical protein